MSLSLTDPLVLSVFERACALVSARGQGLSMLDLSAASALARALVARDTERVDELAELLEIDRDALGALDTAAEADREHGSASAASPERHPET